MSKPSVAVGDSVRVYGDRPTDEHLCTVADLLDTQFTATYEVARMGKHNTHTGWIERTVFRFYKDEGNLWRKES